MNENTKLFLAFMIGLLVGVLGATSTLFKDEPEPPAMEIVTTDPGSEASPQSGAETVQNAAVTTMPQAQVEQPRSEPEETGTEVLSGDTETDLSQNEPDESETEVAESSETVVSEAEEADAEESEDRFFCMLIESQSQCRCFDVETNAPVNISAEQCREQLAAE